jgi:hypothetical protein
MHQKRSRTFGMEVNDMKGFLSSDMTGLHSSDIDDFDNLPVKSKRFEVHPTLAAASDNLKMLFPQVHHAIKGIVAASPSSWVELFMDLPDGVRCCAFESCDAEEDSIYQFERGNTGIYADGITRYAEPEFTARMTPCVLMQVLNAVPFQQIQSIFQILGIQTEFYDNGLICRISWARKTPTH